MIWLYGLILWVAWRVLRDFALIEEKKIIDDLERGKCEMKVASPFGKMKDGDTLVFAKLADFAKFTNNTQTFYTPLAVTADNSVTLRKGFSLEECHSCQGGSNKGVKVRLISERGKALKIMDLKDEWAFYSVQSDVGQISGPPTKPYVSALKRLRIENTDPELKGKFVAETEADLEAVNAKGIAMFVGGNDGCKLNADYCTRFDLCGGIGKVTIVSDVDLDPVSGCSQSDDCKTAGMVVLDGSSSESLLVARLRAFASS